MARYALEDGPGRRPAGWIAHATCRLEGSMEARRDRRNRGPGWRRLRAVGALALIAGATACSKSDDRFGPPGSQAFDPARVANSIFSLRFAADNVVVAQLNPIAQALGLTADAVPAGGERLEPLRLNRAPVDRARPSRAREPRDRAALLRRFPAGSLEGIVANRAARRAAGGAVPIFPINYLGKTFIFDAGIDAYVETSLGGAPQNGVRFELYVFDLDVLLPALPLEPIGWVDLTDVSDAVSSRLRIRAVDTRGPNNILLADYVIDVAFASNPEGIAVSLLADGFVQDDQGRFDFSLDELLEGDDFAGTTRITSVHDLISDEGTDVRLEVSGDLSNDGLHSDLFFKWDIDGAGGLTLVDLRVTDGIQDGEIRQRNRLEVIVNGTVQNPTFTPVEAFDFTGPELDALNEILFGIDDVLFFVSEVWVPLADLFGVG